MNAQFVLSVTYTSFGISKVAGGKEQEKNIVKSTAENHETGSQQDTRGMRKEIWSDRDVTGVTIAPDSMLMWVVWTNDPWKEVNR